YAIVRLTQLASRRVPALGPALAVLGTVLLLGQGTVYSLHSAMTLSRADTRNTTRQWLVDHVPANTRIVVEPGAPDAWASDRGRSPTPATSSAARRSPTRARPTARAPSR